MDAPHQMAEGLAPEEVAVEQGPPPPPVDMVDPEPENETETPTESIRIAGNHRIEVLKVDRRMVSISLTVLGPTQTPPKTTTELAMALLGCSSIPNSVVSITRLATVNWGRPGADGLAAPEHLPGAVYRIKASEEVHTSHLKVGMRWEPWLDNLQADDAPPPPLMIRTLPSASAAERSSGRTVLLVGLGVLGVLLLTFGAATALRLIAGSASRQSPAEPTAEVAFAPSRPEPTPEAVAMAAPAMPAITTPLMFELRRVDYGQRLLTRAPFHAKGGDWTFAEAQTSDGCAFSIGVQVDQRASTRQAFMAFSSLSAADCLTRALGAQQPVSEFLEEGPIAVQLPLGVVGLHQARTRDGHFVSAPNGPWLTSTLDINGAALPLNLNLQRGKGSFFSRDVSTTATVGDELVRALVE